MLKTTASLAISIAFTLQAFAQTSVFPAEATAQRPPRVFTNMDGTGTANRVPLWVDLDTLGDSVLYQVSGNIGVGTDQLSGTRRVVVDVGTVAESGIQVIRLGLTSRPRLELLVNSVGTPYGVISAGDSSAARNLILNPIGGRVGIGSVSPLHPLSVYGPATLNSGVREVLSVYDSTSFAAEVGGAVAFGGKIDAAGSYAQQFASIQGFKENATDGNNAGGLRIYTRANAVAPAERVRIASNGYVGIGTSSPTHLLHVNGNAHFNGVVTGTEIRATFQDLAEWVPARTDLEPGTVVVLDPEIGNGVMASSQPYDTAVAGVVSAQPGISLGVPGAAKEQIATTGRVRVRVDATAAPIRVGDLLVTSERPGTAMRSEPMDIRGRKFHQPGTILGKALEPLESGQGEILVLLSMQ